MHTPAKGAGPNKGLGGSNPPFSAKFCCGTGVLKNTYKNAINFAISIKRLARRSRRVDGLFLSSCRRLIAVRLSSSKNSANFVYNLVTG